MNRQDREFGGISETMGAISLIGVMAIVIAVFAVAIFSGMGGEEVPAVKLSNETIKGPEGNKTLVIYHEGGDELLRSETSIWLDGIVRTSNFTDSSGEEWERLAAGESIKMDITGDPESILVISTRNPDHPSIIYLSGGEEGLIIYNPPVAHFSGSPRSGAVPLTVDFFDTSIGVRDSWEWDFGDGGTSTEKNPTHTYTSVGTYDVRLTVFSNIYGPDSEFIEDYIDVKAIPVNAEFTGSPRDGERPLEVNFTDLSAGYPTSWYWDFGDNSTSTEQNPSHVYDSAGLYDVSLIATNSYNSNGELKAGYINVTLPPLDAYFIGYPENGAKPLTVTFTDLSSGDLVSWEWDFGDGGTSALRNPAHTYTSEGIYDVSLTVTDSVDVTDTHNRTGYINVTEENVFPPDAQFSGYPLYGTVSVTVDFTDLSTGDPDSWFWEFGDGSTSTEQNPSHEYSSLWSTEMYDVSLTVTNPVGSDTEEKISYIVVTGILPDSGFVGEPVFGAAPLTVSFTDLTSGIVDPILDYEYSWEFGDGGTSTQQNPVHTYTDPGTYTVKLTVRVYLFGFIPISTIVEEKTDYIIVGTAPVAAFSGNPLEGVKPLTVSFTDESTGAPNSWLWDFGDDTISKVQNPSHEYSGAGIYTVSLTVSNSFGNNTLSKNNYVNVENS